MYIRTQRALAVGVSDADTERLAKYVKENGPPNKGKKMSKEFCEKCSKSAKRRWGMAKR